MIGKTKDNVFPLPVYDKHNISFCWSEYRSDYDCILVGWVYPIFNNAYLTLIFNGN